MLTLEQIARVCHSVNKAYCESIGDNSQVSWDKAPKWQKESAISGVRFQIETNATPEEIHHNWIMNKEKDGWKYGPVKDAEKKEHPCMVSYDKLDVSQRTKDYIFSAVVDELKQYLISDNMEM